MTDSTRKEERSREIVVATRELFDSRGMREAQIEDIARAVGINRAIIYRHFTTKEELFAMVLVDYLGELESRLAAVRDASIRPSDELRALSSAYFAYGVAHPAFVDCAQALLRFRGADLVREIAPEPLMRLGVAMSQCLEHTVEVFERGNAEGEFSIPDPDFLANVVYTQGLGLLNLANFQMSVRELDPGMAIMENLSIDRIVDLAEDALVAFATMHHRSS